MNACRLGTGKVGLFFSLEESATIDVIESSCCNGAQAFDRLPNTCCVPDCF